MATEFERLKAGFAEPDPHYGPVPFWWWSGEEVTEERVRWQLQKFRESGLRNIGIIHLAPTGPQYGSRGDSPAFMSEPWWRLFESALREAERLGMRLWFYDQIGFSGANAQARLVAAHPEFAGHHLRRYAEAEPLPPGAELLLESAGYRYAAVRQGYNWLDPKASAAVLDRVHGEMERRFPRDLGRTIAGSFQDELPPLPLWSPDVPRIYEERFGESLVPALPALFDAVPGGEEVRRRVYGIAAELAERAFFVPLGEWHRKHGMLIACDQAGPARRVDVHGAQRLYLDYFRTHRWYNSPGSDMEGEIKPHASMAHLQGGSRVFLEAFHSSGWGGTIEETMHWLVPWFQAGATLFSPHAVYYSTRGGWWEWAPPDTGWRQPYFEHYGIFADTVSRVSRLLSEGTHVADIAVHYPSYAAVGYMSLDDIKPLEHPMAASNRDPNGDVTRLREAYRDVTGAVNRKEAEALPGSLRSRHLDFDVVDDSALEKADVADGTLAIAGERFGVFVLCGTTVMRPKARERVKRLLEQGGLVVGVNVPETERAVFPGAVYVKTAEEMAALVERRLAKRVEGPGLSLQRRAAGADVFMLLPKDGELLRMHEPADASAKPPGKAEYRLRTSGSPQLWDPVAGTAKPVAFEREGEWVRLRVEFRDWPAALIVCAPEPGADTTADARKGMTSVEAGDRTEPADARQEAATGKPGEEAAWDSRGKACPMPPPSGGRFPAATGAWPEPEQAGVVRTLEHWRVRVEPTLDNRYGDFDLHNGHRGSMPPERRIFLARTESGTGDGLAAGWHLPGTPDADWDARLWSEAAYWRACKGDAFRESESWPVVYSAVFGDLAFRSWAGRMGRVPRKFLHLGEAAEGETVWARTNVIAPRAGRYWIRAESNADLAAWIGGHPVEWSGGPEEQTAWVELEEGANELLLRAAALADGLVRAGIEINDRAGEPLPKWIHVRRPNPESRLNKALAAPAGCAVRAVRAVFAARGRAILQLNGATVTEHGDFNPYIRQGQEEVDLTPYWRDGDNEVAFVLPEGAGEVFADGRIELPDGGVIPFCTGLDWRDEKGEEPLVLHSSVLQFAETESLWLNPRPHPLPGVGWLMPESAPERAPLPFANDPEAIGKPVWLRFPLPVGACGMRIAALGRARAWVGGVEIPVADGFAAFPPRAAGTAAAVRIEPAGMPTEAAVLAEPIRFDVVPFRGALGDWRTALHLPHHSGAVEYETTLDVPAAAAGVLDLGHVRGTAEVWLDGEPLGVRVWRPYRFALGALAQGARRLRIRVTNTLGTFYEYGRPTSLVGANPAVTYWGRTDRPEWRAAFPSGGLYGPVRVAWIKDEKPEDAGTTG
ncbi:hypothetical protein [Cohnella massiliensis]|uniref:hypothetical protein n=1 Tax=Cohnella massiliensis TaxID=1816691 RepID=UPI0009B98744|nr:hypothetical protein [Cohnella massiliensis]